MLELKIELKNKTSYTNFGNFLVKALIIKNNLNNLGKTLLIVENEKWLDNFKKILLFIGVESEKVKESGNLTNMLLNNKGLFLSTIDIFKQENITINKIKNESIFLKVGENIYLEEFLEKLIKLGYKFSDYNAKGSYNKSGDIITINSFNLEKQYKISFWGDTIEEIMEIKLENSERKSIEKLKEVYIGGNNCIEYGEDFNLKDGSFLAVLEKQSSIFTILDSLEFTAIYDDLNNNLNHFCCFDFISNPYLEKINLDIDSPKIENIEELKKCLKSEKIVKKIIITRNQNLINNFLDFNKIGNTEVLETKLNNLKSFEVCGNKDAIGEVVICDDIISKIFIKKRTKKSLSSDLDLLLKIKPGDFVVHIDHGIGIFKQIIKKQLNNINKEYIEIEYSGNDKLFVPIREVGRVNKYVGIDNPKLTGLNTKEWERKLSKANKDTSKIALELLEVYSKRKIINKTPLVRIKDKEVSFRDSFEYIYTEDQSVAIEEILGDLEKDKPAERLLVGDVGFGKTEIAFNAIFTNFLNKKQSILISPLVVLTYEHYEKARERFKKWGLNVGVLTRLESVKDTNITIRKLELGEIDLIIGTHKVLSDKIKFKDLGLIVIDEEHKFGVEDKEKIKKLRNNVDVLSMSATPIPRSLNMALSNLKDISILKNAPYGRQDISTIVSIFSEKIILDACKREFERNGQVFFVHNRVRNIGIFEKMLNSLFPNKKVIITHGRLPGNELEKRIIDFKNKKYDILLSTTVIENGIDFSNVNTIIINDSPQFGVSQIHQLRGRVGRSDKKGYCYLLYKKENLKEDTAKRLKTIVEYSYLGAGFELAMKDLEIRGGGDILGVKQSGKVTEIGVNLFLKMIEDKIAKLKAILPSLKEGEDLTSLLVHPEKERVKIDLNIEIFIPDSFFSSDLDKLNFYREIENINDITTLNDVKKDFEEVNNILPQGIINLFKLLKLSILSKKFLIKNIKKVGVNYQLDFDKDIKLEELKSFLKLDKEVKFAVVDINRLRTSIKSFDNEEKFLEYLLFILEGKIKNKKIKLKLKA